MDVTFTDRLPVPERRIAPRFPTNRPGRMRDAGSRDGWGRAVPVVACDVSAGGFMLASSHRGASLEKGARLEVKLLLDDGGTVLPARVAWSVASRDAWIAGVEVCHDELDAGAAEALRLWSEREAGLR